MTSHPVKPDPNGRDNCVSCGAAIRYKSNPQMGWEHVPVLSPFVRRAIARELPAKETVQR